MNGAKVIVCVVLIAGCGRKAPEATACEAVTRRLAELDAGQAAAFMSDSERTARARRWIARCEPMPEAERRCVLAAKTMDDAEACRAGRGASSTPSEASAKAAWVVRGGDEAYQTADFVALAPDGDVVTAGNFAGTLDLGGQVMTAQRTDGWIARLSPKGTVRWATRVGGEGREYVNGLALNADGTVVVTMQGGEGSDFLRVTRADDGSVTSMPLATEYSIHDAALHADGDVVVGSAVVPSAKGSSCPTGKFVLQRFTAEGERRWSRCNDANGGEIKLADTPMQLAVGPGGVTAACGNFYGTVSWGAMASTAGQVGKSRAFVLVVDGKGEPRWVRYLAGPHNAFCDALAVADDGSVVAITTGTSPGYALASWNPDGTERWTKSCAELLGESDPCQLWAVTAHGADVVVGAQQGSKTVIATIDGESGTTTQARRFEGVARIEGLAARANDVVFAAGFDGTVDFGTGPLKSTASTEYTTSDVLIGHL